MRKTPIYVSTDIEANGFAVGKNSILSLASAAFYEDKTLANTFTVNLETLPEGEGNPDTITWWKGYPEAWQAARKNCVSPEQGMREYAKWIEQLPGYPIFVGAPVAFDFAFVSYYLERFVGYNPFGFSSIDLRSLVMGLRKMPFSQSSADYWPKRWFEDKPHTHIALDDAIEQGIAFCNMLAEYPQLKILVTQNVTSA